MFELLEFFLKKIKTSIAILTLMFLSLPATA